MQITPLAAIPTIGALLGVKGNSKVVELINSKYGNTCFGSDQDPFKEHYSFFMKEIVTPIRQISEELYHTHKRIISNDQVITLSTTKDLYNVPPCMKLPLLTGPLWDSFSKGRIDGWGFIMGHVIGVKSTYDRIVRQNGIRDITLEELTRTSGTIEFTNIHETEDPYYSPDELEMLRDSSEYIDVVLQTTNVDPTDPSQLRG